MNRMNRRDCSVLKKTFCAHPSPAPTPAPISIVLAHYMYFPRQVVTKASSTIVGAPHAVTTAFVVAATTAAC